MAAGVCNLFIFAFLLLQINCGKTQSNCNFGVKEIEYDSTYSDTTTIVLLVNNFDYSSACYDSLVIYNNNYISFLKIDQKHTYYLTYLNYSSELANIIDEGNYYDFTSGEFSKFILLKCGFSSGHDYLSIVLWRYGEPLKTIE